MPSAVTRLGVAATCGLPAVGNGSSPSPPSALSPDRAILGLPSRVPGFFLLPGRVSFVLRALAALARNEGAHLSGRKTAYVPRCLPQPAAEAPVLLAGASYVTKWCWV